ncbi:MAG: repeat-containing protein [Caulobacteraceae bacterium]|nr:repeat-containing protein [Caulobacteraceae bacterium]
MSSIDAIYLTQAANLRSLGRLEEAVEAYRKAARLSPRNAQTLVDLGSVLVQLGLDEEAQAAFAEAAVQTPKRADAWILRGNALYRLGRFEEALAMQNRALRLTPDFAPSHFNRGNALLGLFRYEEAIASFDRALALERDFTAALINKGGALHALRRYEEVIRIQNTVEALTPGLANTMGHRGAALLELGRYEEAASDLTEAIRRARGDHPKSELDLSSISLLHGDFANGWKQLEARKSMFQLCGSGPYFETYGAGPYRNREWSGSESLAGKTLLAYAEQGLGDTIQFCRYLSLARARGAHVVLVCPPILRRLISTTDPEIEIIGPAQPVPRFDYHLPLLSFPHAFGDRMETIPGAIPYLAAEPERVASWRNRLGGHGYRIGVAWKGSAAGALLGKAFPVALLKNIAALPGVRLINLQTAEGREELDKLPPGMVVEQLGEEFDAGPDAFLDTAAVMESLDLVITTDTAVAHLAGALGRPTWVALKHVPDWRWMLDRHDTPWYPTMRLYRQAAIEDWSGVFEAMERDLGADLSHEPPRAFLGA